MAYREFHYRWEHDLKASPEQLWPFVSDTNRFNRDTGVPSVATVGDDASGRRLRLSSFGMPLEWEEQPFEWVRPARFGVTRRYFKGPMAELTVRVELTPRPEGGTKLIYEIWATPKSPAGLVAIPLLLGIISARRFAKAYRIYDQLALSGESTVGAATSPEFAAAGRNRLNALRHKLIAQGVDPQIANRLADFLERADDFDVARIRPYALADDWKESRRAVLEACLWATRIGLLDLQWDLLCPMCRGPQETSASLRELNAEVHCEGCRIDFTVNFDRYVEVTFGPNPNIRSVDAKTYCVGSPQRTPHVVVQQTLPAGTDRTLTLPLEAGRYRVRAVNLPGEQAVRVAEGGRAEALIVASPAGWANDEISLSPSSSLRLENKTDAEQLFLLERTAWSDQAATAAEVTALQIFRDLFSTEALRPGEQISVGTLTVLFTDLRNSTRLYRDIGDATAFGRVMNHFDVLKEVIAAHDGALVKTIGDAVMAVFREPAAALGAMLDAQELLASPAGGSTPLTLKAGLHTGPCIAVTLNDRLDYFGSTVNMAARLEGLSTGTDVVISRAVFDDLGVREFLEGSTGDFSATRFEVDLKGFDDERFELWRIARGAAQEMSESSTAG